MKLAIVHDELVRKGGAEQVALSFHKAFPDAVIYTLSYNPETTFSEFKSCNVITSWFGRYIKDEKNLKRFFFPFGVIAMQQMHVKGYDVVLQSSTHCSKYVKVDPGTLILTYCHTPFRLIWRPDSYKEVVNSGIIKRKLYDLVIKVLRKIDKKYADKTDWFITNARQVVPRIIEAYQPRNKVPVINPPVKCQNFYVSDEPGDYYLMVSRFEPYKKVDLVIDVFNKMQEKNLIIVGTGSTEKTLRKKAGKNITFLSSLSTKELADVYAHSKALIFPQLEDYGIAPLEANASGRPVIAFGQGGVLDTMIPVTKNNAHKATAIFFKNQTEASLTDAIKAFEKMTFDPLFIRSHAERFDESTFVDKIRNFVSWTITNSRSRPVAVNPIINGV